ncbi:MAG: uracil-DNA glycosylase [Deltaproteobacteria bacterium]|nr:uracil-DNA glycosylase [Deltaproteobacteria bacterium]
MNARSAAASAWAKHERAIVGCAKCPRLRKHCLEIARVKRKSYAGDTYWGKPIVGFGDTRARLVLVGLAPAAHGANRTGRVFTGDRSGDWLYRALHKAGFANQPTSTHARDGLALTDAFVTATVKCAPPDNKPTPAEIARCLPYLDWEIARLDRARVYLALGKIGWDAAWDVLKRAGLASGARPAFGHNQAVELASGKYLLGSYHPSQQNTFTGRLTEPMFDAVFEKARTLF